MTKGQKGKKRRKKSSKRGKDEGRKLLKGFCDWDGRGMCFGGGIERGKKKQ